MVHPENLTNENDGIWGNQRGMECDVPNFHSAKCRIGQKLVVHSLNFTMEVS